MLVAPVFLGVVFAIALARGVIGAETRAGRIAVILFAGTLLVACVAYSVFLLRQPVEHLEIRPDRIVMWHGPDRGIQLGATPPIVVQRTFIRLGARRGAIWALTDSSGSAYRFVGQTMRPVKGARARIDLSYFYPTAVLEAVQRAVWPAERRL